MNTGERLTKNVSIHTTSNLLVVSLNMSDVKEKTVKKASSVHFAACVDTNSVFSARLNQSGTQPAEACE